MIRQEISQVQDLGISKSLSQNSGAGEPGVLQKHTASLVCARPRYLGKVGADAVSGSVVVNVFNPSFETQKQGS